MFGRRDDVDAVRDRLLTLRVAARKSGSRAILIVDGTPGVGKTTLTRTIAHDTATSSQFPDGLLWASLGQRPSVEPILRSWCDALGLPVNREASGRQLSERIGGYVAERRVLILIDDVWDPRNAGLFLLGGRDCATLVTTRIPKVTNDLSSQPGDTYPLKVLSEDASITTSPFARPKCRRTARASLSTPGSGTRIPSVSPSSGRSAITN